MWFLAPLVFFLTRNPLTGPWRIFFALGALLWLLVDSFLFAKNNQKRKLIDTILFALFLIGATNWFYSPFFFLFYLLTIGVTFILTPASGLGFTVSLVLIFMFNIGEVDVAYDSLVLLSLLGTFPIAMYLRKEYLRLQEGQKHILILEKQAKDANTTVEALLSNIVTYASAELRQPLINIKNYSSVLLASKRLSMEKVGEYLKKIYESSIVALKQINKFDEESTGMTIKPSDTILQPKKVQTVR